MVIKRDKIAIPYLYLSTNACAFKNSLFLNNKIKIISIALAREETDREDTVISL